MAEKIGLEAVLSLGSFQVAVRQYNQAISGMSKNTASTASSISSSFVNLGSGILKVGAIAAGAGLAGIAALTGGLVLLGSTALTEFAKYERMSLSIQSLVARELSQGKLVEQQRSVAISLTQKESKELEGLAGKIHDEELARQTLHARIKEQSEALRQLRDAHGDEALDVQTATARLAELENQYNKSGAEIQAYKDRQVELTNKTGDYVTVIDKVRTGQISMNEAMAQASPRAEELLKWIQLLAIQSPFDSEGVANAFRTALAYGFTTEEAQRLTEAEIDFVAATGRSIQSAELIALALGQIKARGKVLSQELRQLSEQGVNTNGILESMGFNLKDVENGLVPVDEFMNAVIKDMEIFQGAGKAQATTFAGLITSLSELKAIGLREFFTGTFTAIQPYLANFVSMLTSAALETGSIRELGDALGVYVAGGIQDIIKFATQLQEIFGAFQTGGIGGLVAALGITPDAVSLIQKFQGMITEIANTVSGPFMAAFGGLSGGGILDSINQAITFLNDHFTELQGALLGIGAVLATGIFAALVTGILSLLTPINLVIVAAATLGAAWAGNWGNIREIVGSTIAYLTQQFNALMAVLQPSLLSLQESFGRLGITFAQVGVDSTTLTNVLGIMGNFIINTLIPAWVQWIGFLAGVATTTFSAWVTYVQTAYNVWLKFSGFIQSDVIPTLLKINDGITVTNEVLASFGKLVSSVINKALQAMAGLWQNVVLPALQKVGQLLQSAIMPSFQSIGKTVKSDVSPVLRELGETIFPLLQEGLDYVTEAIKDVIAYFDSLSAKVNSFSLPDILTPGSPPPMAYAFMDIAKGVDQAAMSMKDLNTLMTGLKVTDESFIHKFIDDVDIGGALRARNVDRNSALGKGISDALKAGLGGFVTNLQHSPELSDVTNFVEQIAVQWGRSLSSVADKVDIPTLYKSIKAKFDELWGKLRVENLANAIGIAQGFAGVAASFADIVKGQMEGFQKLKDESAKFREENTKLTGNLTEQQLKMAELEKQLESLTSASEVDTLAIERKQLEIAELTTEIDKNKAALIKNEQALINYRKELENKSFQRFNPFATNDEKLQGDLATIELLQEFLKGTGNELRIVGEELGGIFAGSGLTSDIVHNRITAQQELNRLLAEQAQRQQDILNIEKAQKQLDFLSQQINLIKMLSDRGLNPRNILGGIKLGIDASASDLLAATNRVVMAMVNQINSDLQIASPSKVMARIGGQVVAGMAQGIERGRNMLTDTVRNIPLLNGSVPQPIFSQQGGVSSTNQNTYNYNFPMTVNTTASASGVIRQYEVKRSMYAN